MATLRVTRIPFGVNQETMSRIFSQLGPLSVLNRPATPQESAPFETIIEFASAVAADSAIKAINGFCVAGRRLQVAPVQRSPRILGAPRGRGQVSKYEANPGEGNLPAASKTTVAVSESVKPEEALRVILRHLPNCIDVHLVRTSMRARVGTATASVPTLGVSSAQLLSVSEYISHRRLGPQLVASYPGAKGGRNGMHSRPIAF